MTAQNPVADFEALGRQVWDAWSRQWSGVPAAPAAPAAIPGMDGLKGYLDWMQQAAAAMAGQGAAQVPPSANPFAGWAMPGMGSPPAGLDTLRALLDTPAVGYTREQQAQQQAFLRALLDHQHASARYQELLARAQAQGAERMRRKLAEPGFQPDSLKAMYDLWVDAVEEAYAEIALSDEFREAYAAQGNTQMQVRKLQHQQVEQWCREVGLPTRSEVATLGQRVQELRRELRRMQAATPGAAHSTAVKTPRSPASAKRAAAAPRVTTPKARPASKAATPRTPRKPR
ncbi:poly(R)-hydroxyalkanoic acid synthase subunit PhaE [Frateuria soli]|uniref:poly(R)-hydroxyalkanoic acid synthase subunit PhaE n=1 Tax=Frateuria soli TaxID=1542730 RepID=UPI001E2AA7E6|nr:poly(R)-hydroxyalkanoic acid synthase subunit PhaE [Frateuria soli]UGB36909.1 pha synthase subunit protein [Frateuria soli]